MSGRNSPRKRASIHYGEAVDRHIYGETTMEEAQELADEGVDVAPLPPDLDSAN